MKDSSLVEYIKLNVGRWVAFEVAWLVNPRGLSHLSVDLWKQMLGHLLSCWKTQVKPVVGGGLFSTTLRKFCSNLQQISPFEHGNSVQFASEISWLGPLFPRFFDKGLERVTILWWSKAENPIFLPNTSFLTLIKDLIHPPNQPIFVFFFFLMILTNNSVGGMMLYRSIK